MTDAPFSSAALRRAETELWQCDDGASRSDFCNTVSGMSITATRVVRSGDVRHTYAPPSALSPSGKAVGQACSPECTSGAQSLQPPLVCHVGERSSSDGIPRVPTLDLALLHARPSASISSLGEHDQAPPPQVKPQEHKADIVGQLNAIQSQLERKLSTVRIEYQKKLSESAMVGFARRRSARMSSLQTDESISLHSESSFREKVDQRPESRGYSGAHNVAAIVNTRGRQRNAPPPRMAAGGTPRRPSGEAPNQDKAEIGAPITRYATFSTAKCGSRMPSRFAPPDWNALIRHYVKKDTNGSPKQHNKSETRQAPPLPPAQPDNSLPSAALTRPPEARDARMPPPLRFNPLHRKNENAYDVDLVNKLCRRAPTNPVGPATLGRTNTTTIGKFEGARDSALNDARRSNTAALLLCGAGKDKEDANISLVTFPPTSPTLSEQDLSSKTVTDDGWVRSPIARAYSYVDWIFQGTGENEESRSDEQRVSQPPSPQVAGGDSALDKRYPSMRSLRYPDHVEGAMPRPTAPRPRVEAGTDTGNEGAMRRQTTAPLRRRDTYTVNTNQIREKIRALASHVSEPPSDADDDDTSYQVVSVSGSDLDRASGQYGPPEQQQTFSLSENVVERNVDAGLLTHLPTMSGNCVKGIAGYSMEQLYRLSRVNSKCALLRHGEPDAPAEMGNTSGFGHPSSLRTSVTPWFKNPLNEKVHRERARSAKHAAFIPNAQQVEDIADADLKNLLDQIATYRLDLEEPERHGVMDPFYEYEKMMQNKTLASSDWARYGRPAGRQTPNF
ncbi:hypothetical protein, conserved [Babesia bigemina]|uniref:Uncharacterized protein n=1 Tax=Babesia bigemina TaxID=5866 RepID=A0A061D297_BABBI|nr:hypothetical protein, conserved [Babesia bigemina]CDR94733.1 hypothetical protein, conserved [Babesia bigemina]|eukprot:XP_012766919.1 hypothetical protein, conserved [Babesia bigemina]